MNEKSNSVRLWLYAFLISAISLFCNTGSATNITAGPSAIEVRTHAYPIDEEAGLEILERPLLDFRYPDEMIPGYGFFPMEILVTNKKDRSRELRVSLGFSDMVFTIQVAPLSSVSHILYFPLSATPEYSYKSGSITITESGYGTIGRGKYYHRSGSGTTIAGTAPFLYRDLLAKKAKKLSFAAVDFSTLPSDWKIYTPIDCILIGTEEFKELDQARQTLIKEWVAHGGELILNGKDSPLATQLMGLGQVHHFNFDVSQEMEMEKLLDQINSLAISSRPLGFAAESYGSPFGEYILRLPPVTILVVLAFVVLIGPLNLWVFAPVGKRYRLFYTTPLISVSFGVILFLFILLIDGFGGKGDRTTYVDLFPEGNSAWITQSQISKTGVLRDTAFSLSRDALISVKKSNNRSYWESEDGYRNGTDASGYFSSRSTRLHNLSERVLTRGSIHLMETDEKGVPTLLSSLSSDLKDVYYQDLKGRIWFCPKLEPGRKTECKGMDAEAIADTYPHYKPLKGYFIAKGSKSELAPIETLPSINWEDHVIYRGPVVTK